MRAQAGRDAMAARPAMGLVTPRVIGPCAHRRCGVAVRGAAD